MRTGGLENITLIKGKRCKGKLFDKFGQMDGGINIIKTKKGYKGTNIVED